MMSNGRRGAVVVAAAVCVLGACGSGGGGSSDAAGAKTGGAAGTLTITVADSQPAGHPSNLPLDEFARQVHSLSNGSMTVKVLTDASADAPLPGSDEPVIEKLRAGGFEMAVVPARAWSTAGVTSLRALQTPFLVQSDAQVDAIVRDDALVSDLFAGVGAAGVRGLTMFPESLRHLFSFTTPILAPADVTGRQVRYTSSSEVAHLIETLGATPVDPSGEDFATAVGDGTITAADSGFAIAIHTTPRPATATGNLVLYAKVITLVANAPFWDGLTEVQRTTLQTAADKAQEWAIANEVDDQAAATQYCADGGTVVLSDAASLAAFRAAAAPIYAELEQDPATKKAIAAIDALEPAAPSTGISACSPASAASGFHANGGDLRNGVYRVDMSDEFLRAHHLSDADVLDAHGVFTWRLRDGHWSVDQANDTPQGPTHGEGIYQVDGDRLEWQWDPKDGAIERFTWTADDDGTLHFSQLDVNGDGDLFFLQPWTRIGDV